MPGFRICRNWTLDDTVYSDLPSANLSTAHRTACFRYGRRTALRFKRDGLYRNLSWNACRRQADRAAAGLLELGIQPGDRIALLSENRYEWLIADHAMLSTGAVTVPLHAPLAAEQVAYQVSHSEARGIFVSGMDQAAKVFEVIDRLPKLEFLVSFDRLDDDASCPERLRQLSWLQLQYLSRDDEAVSEIRRREDATDADSLATIIYTSGTTGQPKGVMLAHGNLLSNAAAVCDASGFNHGDYLLSWLPYSHIYARTVDHYLTTIAGSTVCLAESVDTLIQNLRETQPTWMTAVPRFYEKVWTSVEHLPPGDRAAALNSIFGPRLVQLSSGGAPLPRHVCEGFFEANIALLEGYGLTESSPVISFNTLDHNRIGSVGRRMPGVDVKIADDGEILARGPNVMKGYWQNPEATQQTIVDGWLHTGDVGHLDEDGFLFITDRKKDLIITSGGKNIAPSELERLLISDPFIDQAVVFGDGRPFVSALIAPNFEILTDKATVLGCQVESAGGYVQTPALVDFFAERIEAVMESVSRPERVKQFLILDRPLSQDQDELTATLKVRRRHVIEKHRAALESLYNKPCGKDSM